MKMLLTGLFLIFHSYQTLAFSVGTYNLHNMSDLEGLRDDLKNLRHISIFAFQEVHFKDSDQEPDQDRLLSGILPPGQYPYVVTQRVAKDDNGEMEGHAIVSQFPIIKSLVIPLEHTGKKNREALVAWIQVDDQVIMVINTDHEVQYKDLSYLDRKKQLLSLTSALDKIDFKGPQIIVGDFNTSDSIANWELGVSGGKEVTLTYGFFKDRGWQPTCASSEEDYTFQTWGFTQHLDHIIFKNIANDQVMVWHRFDARKGSDHYPIYSFFN